MAAAAFLARYQKRTLEAYRYDLRAFFQWAADDSLDILKAARPQTELYVRAMEARGLAATTIDRRLSTVTVVLVSRWLHYAWSRCHLTASPRFGLRVPDRWAGARVREGATPRPIAAECVLPVRRSRCRPAAEARRLGWQRRR